MATPIWSKVFKSLVTVAAGVGVYRVNNDMCYADDSKAWGIRWDSNWDNRKPLIEPVYANKKEKRRKARIKRNLFLIHHGQHVKDGDQRLTPQGKEQAKLTGLRLKELGFKYRKMLHTSSMIRATETAEIIANNCCTSPLELVPSDKIRDGIPIKPKSEMIQMCLETGDGDLIDDGARLEEAFRLYFHRAHPRQQRESYEIVVCHANVIKYFVCRALQLPPEAWPRFRLHNCSITWFVIYPDGQVRLKAIGDFGHIPKTELSEF